MASTAHSNERPMTQAKLLARPNWTVSEITYNLGSGYPLTSTAFSENSLAHPCLSAARRTYQWQKV
ncbi:hypothetical protein GCM10011378_07580 [Hymenobacter glacieicola]|uniref:Uncharacterized protein n=1 Tax=Hymenobacter glacieicola TaxID=1562124 RepID=A0ABQ1WJX2_9BACT|nr:hypothetical protein GCM10011378_07580 [Hymenobacter glacieicola]